MFQASDSQKSKKINENLMFFLDFLNPAFSIFQRPWHQFEMTFIKFKQNIVLKWLQRRQIASFRLFWGRSGVPFWLLWGVLGPFGPHFIMLWRI